MKSFKMLQVSIGFSTIFYIFSRFWGVASPPDPARNPYVENFLKCSLNIRQNFNTIFKEFQKIAKFLYDLSKKYIFFIDFLTFFEIYRV